MSKDQIAKAAAKMQRTNFTVSRKVTGRGGDTFFSLGVSLDEGTSREEAKIAYMLAFLECSETAFRSARAGSLINDAELATALQGLKHNFTSLIAKAVESEDI